MPEQKDLEIRAVAADSKGGLTWCRGLTDTTESAIMRGTDVLEPAPCQNLALDDTARLLHPGRSAGAVPARARPARPPDRHGQRRLAFALVGPDLYFSVVDAGGERTTTSVHRVPIGGAQPGPARRLAVAVTPDDSSFYRIAVDDRYLYGVDGDSLMWAPQPAGTSPTTFTRFWDGTGPLVMGLTVSATHVYWATSARGGGRLHLGHHLAQGQAGRRARGGDGDLPGRLPRLQAHPAPELPLHGHQLAGGGLADCEAAAMKSGGRGGLLAGALVAAVLGACLESPNRFGSRATKDAGTDAAVSTVADSGGFPDRAPDATAASRPADAPSPGAEPGPLPASPRDGPAEAPPPQPPDAEGAPDCSPGVRACLDRQASRVCSPQGRWLPPDRCTEGATCSGGACVCAVGACEDGVLVDQANYVSALAGAGDFLHYVLVELGSPHAVHTIDLRSGMETGVQPAPAGYEIWPTLAADATGAAYWCRRRVSDMPGIDLVGAVLRGAEVLAEGACKALRVTPAHVTFSVEDENWRSRLYRRALGPGAAATRETIAASNPYGFDVTGTHIYFTTFADAGVRSSLHRVAVDDLSRVQTLGERAGIGTGIFDRVAADGSHVYVSFNDEILRVPVTGGELFQTFWSGGGVQIATIVLGETHVYWATEIPGLNRCSEAAFWRRSKLRDDEPVLLARRDGLCPSGLALAGDRVYAAVVRPLGPSQILRLRR